MYDLVCDKCRAKHDEIFKPLIDKGDYTIEEETEARNKWFESLCSECRADLKEEGYINKTVWEASNVAEICHKIAREENVTFKELFETVVSDIASMKRIPDDYTQKQLEDDIRKRAKELKQP